MDGDISNKPKLIPTRKAQTAPSDALYVKPEKVYPREVSGRFNRLRVLAVVALLGWYYALPWLQWDGRQAVLFDLPARKFYLFGLVLWPQDFIYLALLLVIAGLSLFFFTALAGRLWCGYACPQTVWTEVFLWMERWTEGDRPQRIKLDAAKWSADKASRKAAKHTLWLLFALWTGFTFVGFFSPIADLGSRVFSFTLGPWETFWVLFYALATWGNAGFLREQVCIYMCPYARFQSAMFDKDTLIIGYDPQRGEPRGSRKRGAENKPAELGDCIDCTLCVQVCPTGIDIREGLQYECIACAACIDVCDDVMDRVGYPRGLIRYDTQSGMEGKEARVLRPRTLVYGTILLALIVGFGTALALRVPLSVDALRDRNALYRVIDDGVVENVYTLKVANRSERPRNFAIEVAGLPGLSIDMADTVLALNGGEIREVPARLRAPTEPNVGAVPNVAVPNVGAVLRTAIITITVTATDDPTITASTTASFIRP
ncbi:MAG: cytochrome c oxidase accessory protein CcoG [Xanthomonadaceae bacterium]|nr:cytochrome c oxidase accessory protein CcoG [Xanthomonadaceae bacterium]